LSRFEWRSVFTRKLDDGRITQSSRTFYGPTDSDAMGAAILDARFWKRQNEGDRRVTTHVEKVEGERI
jgi:hypothetical protein